MALFCLKKRKWREGAGGCLLSLFIKVSIVAKQNSELYILTSFTQDIKKLHSLKDFWNSAQAAFNSRRPLVCILEIKFCLYQYALAMKSFFCADWNHLFSVLWQINWTFLWLRGLLTLEADFVYMPSPRRTQFNLLGFKWTLCFQKASERSICSGDSIFLLLQTGNKNRGL